MRLRDYRIKRCASEFRNKSNLGSSDPIEIKSLVQSLKVLTVFKSIGDNFSGMAIKNGEHRFILVNSNNSIGRQHFTIIHELYHLFFQDSFKYMICNTGRFDHKNLIEYQADLFATYVLMPEEGILKRIPFKELEKKNKLSLNTILDIEQYFSCSRFALLIRLSEMDLIDFNKYESYKENVIHSAIMNGYDTTLYKKGNEGLVIGDYGRRAKELFDKQIISESHYLNLIAAIGVDINFQDKTLDDQEL